MVRFLIALVGSLTLLGCAGSGAPTTPDVASTGGYTQTASDTETAPVRDPEEEKLEMLEVPPVEPVAAAPAETPAADDRICRREVRTGTHRAVRVCRTRAEIERMEQESKDTFRDLHESQMQEDRAMQGSRL